MYSFLFVTFIFGTQQNSIIMIILIQTIGVAQNKGYNKKEYINYKV